LVIAGWLARLVVVIAIVPPAPMSSSGNRLGASPKLLSVSKLCALPAGSMAASAATYPSIIVL
jgi:hypothetical protein